MELLTFTIAAGETKRFERAGRYLEIIDATSSLDVYLSDAAGGRADYARGALSGLFLEGNYSAFEVFSATAQTMSLLLTDGRGGSRRQPGVVQVVDGGRSRTLAGQAGFGGGVVAAVPAAFSYFQLWNPPSSGERIVVKAMIVSSTTAGDFAVRSHNAALANLAGTPVSKLNQDLLPAFELRDGSSAGLLGQGYFRVLVAANTAQSIVLQEPIVLAPGFSIIAGANQVNRDAAVVFEFVRETLV